MLLRPVYQLVHEPVANALCDMSKADGYALPS
jgi:hypothetical protein